MNKRTPGTLPVAGLLGLAPLACSLSPQPVQGQGGPKTHPFADRGGSLKERLERRWAFEKQGAWAFVEGESAGINKRIGALGRDKALAELDEAQQAYPKKLDVNYYRARVYLNAGDTKKALEEYTKLMKLPARNEFDYEARVVVLFKTDQFDQALENLNEAIRRLPAAPSNHCRGVTR
jgi:tetratricopeptide (TPR) repeat protein